VVSQATKGSAAVNGLQIVFTPDPGFIGDTSFTYTATNAVGTSAPATVTVTVLPAAGSTTIASSVLPSSRSVQLGQSATVFATILNTGLVTATACRITLISATPATLSFQTTDSQNTLTGTPDTSVDITAGAGQSFIITVTPTAVFAATDVAFNYVCDNAAAASLIGVNTLSLSASATPVPDIVALAATPTDPGIVNIPGQTGTGFFAVASVNVGAAGTVTVSADTGSVTLPVSLNVCQTDPVSGVCTSALAVSIEVTIAAGATPTFAAFITGNGAVAFDPAVNRAFLRFAESDGSGRGSTSVALRTQ